MPTILVSTSRQGSRHSAGPVSTLVPGSAGLVGTSAGRTDWRVVYRWFASLTGWTLTVPTDNTRLFGNLVTGTAELVGI